MRSLNAGEAEQNSQICAALFYKSDVLRNNILIHKELNKNIFFLQDILMPRIYVKCKNCLNFKYIKGKKLMKVMILPNNSILEYVRFFYYLPLDIYCEIKNSNNQNYSIRINFYYQNNLIYHIFSNNDFSDYDFILDPSGHNLNWKLSDGCYYIDYLELEETHTHSVCSIL